MNTFLKNNRASLALSAIILTLLVMSSGCSSTSNKGLAETTATETIEHAKRRQARNPNENESIESDDVIGGFISALLNLVWTD